MEECNESRGAPAVAEDDDLEEHSPARRHGRGRIWEGRGRDRGAERRRKSCCLLVWPVACGGGDWKFRQVFRAIRVGIAAPALLLGNGNGRSAFRWLPLLCLLVGSVPSPVGSAFLFLTDELQTEIDGHL